MIFGVALWTGVTVAHGAATAALVLQATRNRALDERLLAIAIAWVASLSIVLHTVALTVGLSLTTGSLAMAAWSFTAALSARRLRSGAEPRIAAAGATLTWPQALSLGAIVLAGLWWIATAADSASVSGPDAAHYHVPYALNLALGASPFDLPATPHLYPMAAGAITAWFILPTGGPLLVDLATVLAGLLVVFAINQLFHSMTGRSGLAWTTWVGLALLSTPLFRMTSEGGADLWFGAATVALLASVVRAGAVRQVAAIDVVLGAGLSGFLVGTKTTGAIVLALMAAVAVAAFAIERLSSRGRVSWSVPAWAWLSALPLAAGAGGVWLIRNWLHFGSPLAPAGLTIAGLDVFPGEGFSRSRYFSVLAEMDTESFELWARARHFTGEWLGSWYLVLMLPAALLAVDLAVRFARRDSTRECRARTWAAALTTGIFVPLIWLLIGAPWTGLERSQGLTLRYVLPLFVALPALAMAGLFPLSVPWHRWLPAPRGLVRLPPRVCAAVVIVASVVFVWHVGRRADAWRRSEGTRLADLAIAAAAHTGINNWKAALPAVLEAERAHDIVCGRRRFFSLIRFDEPLSLQPAGLGAQVFYAGRDPERNLAAGPIGRCDYVISSPALMQTVKGGQLAASLAHDRPLAEIARTPDFVVLGMR